MSKKTFFKKSLLCFVFLFPFLCYAGQGGFPLKEILVQVFNFSIFFGLLIFFVKKPLKSLLHKRQRDFLAFEEQALSLEKEKKEEEKLWDKKLKDLWEQEQSIKQRAEAEGKRFIQKKQQELKIYKQQLQNTAKLLIHLEQQKAKNQLLKKWKAKTVQQAEKALIAPDLPAHKLHENRLEKLLKQLEKAL